MINVRGLKSLVRGHGINFGQQTSNLKPSNPGPSMRFVESSILIDKPASVVLSAFTDHQHLKNWWGVERSLIELKKGGLYSLVWQTNNAINFVSTGVIEEYLPGCQLKVERMAYFNPHRPVFGPMALMILTTPEEIGTTLTVVQSGYQHGSDWDWYYHAVKDTWPLVLVKIKDYLEKSGS